MEVTQLNKHFTMIQENLFNIDYVIEALKFHHINRVVISPGGTNIALVKKLQEDSFFKCYSVVDERSAMYFAIGLYLQTGEIIATSCTSAQATRNYIPGLTEAYYKKAPILAITMSKHPRFTYQGYMQAPDQTSLPKDSIKKSFCLPFVDSDSDKLFSMRVINEAIAELKNGSYGPVQLNIPWQDFQLDYSISKAKNIGIASYFNITGKEFESKRILIVIGESRPYDEETIKNIEKFAKNTNTVVYTNHLSNFNSSIAVSGNFLLTCINHEEFVKELMPDMLITIGGQTGDYPLYNQLSKICYDKIEHWHISSNNEMLDTYDHLSLIVKGTASEFFSHVCKCTNCYSNEYRSKWSAYIRNMNNSIQIPFSNAYCASKLSSMLPKMSIVNFAILNSLRVWNWFTLDRSITCYSTVAAFGIDGGTSMLLGESVESESLSFLITGDLAFFYDLNALGIRHIRNNVRILLVNNNGGVEFKYKALSSTYEERNKYIAAAGHFRNAKGWSETCGFTYLPVRSKQEFDNVCERFVSESETPLIIEAFVSDADEALAYKSLLEANKKHNVTKEISKKIKSIIKSI